MEAKQYALNIQRVTEEIKEEIFKNAYKQLTMKTQLKTYRM